MAELKNDEEEHALPSKRKPVEPNPSAKVPTDDKKQKLDSLNSNSEQKTASYQNDDEEEEDEEEDEYEAVDDDDSDSDEEESGGEEEEEEEAVIDRKGKGIMKDDVKGKGKMIEQESDDDDSSNVASESDGCESDLSDDPLAEVDLDNILPSRTRRRVVRPGLNISGKDKGDDNDA